jgi:hypothetical protein
MRPSESGSLPCQPGNPLPSWPAAGRPPPAHLDRYSVITTPVYKTIPLWEQGETHPTGPALKLLNLIADKGLQAIL